MNLADVSTDDLVAELTRRRAPKCQCERSPGSYRIGRGAQLCVICDGRLPGEEDRA